MKRDATIRIDRIPNAVLTRLCECPGPIHVPRPAWDGIDLTDLVHDLMLARAQRDRLRRDLDSIVATVRSLERVP